MAEKLNEVPVKESSPPCKDKQQEKDPTKTLLESPEGQKEQLQVCDLDTSTAQRASLESVFAVESSSRP